MISLVDETIEKFRNKEATVAVIGLGYVGLPLTALFVAKGFTVIGLDVDSDKVEKLKKGESYIEHLDITPLKKAFDKSRFYPSTDFSQVASADAIIICVPTPLNAHREPDLSFITNSLEMILPFLEKGQLLALESTTYPGTTAEELRPRIEAAGFTVGEDFFLVYSPEREDPNNVEFTTETIPKICGGSTSNCLAVGKAMYEQVVATVVTVSSTKTAEMAKILENTFRAVNIALVNELKIVAEKMDVDIFEVIRAAATKPFGFMPFYPGPGLGGHCIPIDPFYLTWKAREYGVTTKFIELAGEVNVAMPDYVLARTMEALNTVGLAMNGARILVLGLAYKKNVDDARESPSVVLLKKLLEKGAKAAYSDPHIPKFPVMRKYKLALESVTLTKESMKEFDCVLIATSHDAFDWEWIYQNASLIVDTRGIYSSDDIKVFRA